MIFQTSPGVTSVEIDQLNGIPAVSNTIGAYVGNFRWGPVDERTLVDSEQTLAKKFAPPSKATAVDFIMATQFLKYTRALEVVRAVTAAAKTGNSGGSSAITIKNDAAHEAFTYIFATHGMWIAKYPGALGNSLSVSLFGVKTDDSTTATNFAAWDYRGGFDGPPSTSEHAASVGAENDEVHIAVIDEDGLFTGVPGTVLERFPYASLASNAKSADGGSIYFKDVINAGSNYVRFGAVDTTNLPQGGAVLTSGTDFGITPVSSILENSLSAGADSAALTSSELILGYDMFADRDTVDVSLFIGNAWPAGSGATVANAIISITADREESVACIGPEVTMLTETAQKTFFAGVSASSYAFYDSGIAKVYDKYNDQFVTIPLSSTVAGIIAEAWETHGPWVSPAGERRGQIRGITKLLFNPNKAQRDVLYKASINPIVTFPGKGTLLFGDKTAVGRPGSFDRINVRGLFNYLKKGITRMAQGMLFEFNDVFTRSNFVQTVEPELRSVKGRGGIYASKVKCDEDNNTQDIIDGNGFVGQVYVSPAKSINFIELQFIATRTGVEFKEIAG